MVAEKENKQIYIVISQTGTLLSRILKRITGAEYNHVSLALSSDLNELYSFGRKYPYNPFCGGFVTESADFGTFKRFYNTKILVLSLDIDSEKHDAISKKIKNMLDKKSDYRYNYLGLYFAALKIDLHFNNRYYCSEFLKYILQTFEIEGSQNLAKIPQPIHFLCIPDTNLIYSGKLQDYKDFYFSTQQSEYINN